MNLFQSETIEESLADLWETVRPGSLAAAHFREAVGAMTQDQLDQLADAETVAEAIRAVLHGIGEPSKRAKHDEPGPCRRHLECLAATVEAVLAECDL